MRGSAVPTIVWSRAARKRARPTPTVARIRALRVSSAGIDSLLGRGFDRVIHVRQRSAQTCAFLGGEPRDHAGYAALHDLAGFVELARPLTGQLDPHDTPSDRILNTADDS